MKNNDGSNNSQGIKRKIAPTNGTGQSSGSAKKGNSGKKDGADSASGRGIQFYFAKAQVADPKKSRIEPKAPVLSQDAHGSDKSASASAFTIKTAVVSNDSVEGLLAASNLRRREAFLAHKEARRAGKLQKGSVDELLFKFPTCENCRSLSMQWVTQSYGSYGSEKTPIAKASHSFWYFGSNTNHFNVKIAVPNHIDGLMAKSPKAPYLIQIVNKRKYQNETLRKLRWISTVAYAWMILQGIKPEEIQTADDGTSYWITENTGETAQALKGMKRVAMQNITSASFRKGILELKRQQANNKSKSDGSGKGRGSAKAPKITAEEQRMIARFARHHAHLVTDGFFQEKKAIRVIGTGKNQHAETKLIDHFVMLSRQKGSEPTVVAVAGIRRPCFVCYARLQVAKERLKKNGWGLIHKKRPGPYWPSEDALRGATRDELQRVMDNLHSGWHMYVNGPLGYDGNNRISQRHKDQTWDDLDTDSDNDGPEDDDEDDAVVGNSKGSEQDMSSEASMGESGQKDVLMQAFLTALGRLDAPVRASPLVVSSRSDKDKDEKSDLSDNDDGLPIEEDFDLLDDVGDSLFVREQDVGKDYWQIDTLANLADGDCLFHSLAAKDLTLDEVIDVRQEVSLAPNHCRISDSVNADNIKQAFLQSLLPDPLNGREAVPDDVYFLMHRIPQIYAGDDEINKWCSAKGLTVSVVAHDRSFWEYGANLRRPLAGSHDVLRTELHRRIQSHAIVLWKTSNHFERVIGISAPVDNVDDELLPNDDVRVITIDLTDDDEYV